MIVNWTYWTWDTVFSENQPWPSLANGQLLQPGGKLMTDL